MAPGFIEVLGDTEDPSYGLKSPTLTYRITLSDDTQMDYMLGKLEEGNYYALKVSNKPFYFKLSGFQADKVIKATRESLVEVKEVEAEVKETATSEETQEEVIP